MLAHWPFTGNANDASGNGYHGTPSNISPTTGMGGLPNTAYLFNNANSVINVGYNSNFNISNVTICAVFKPTALYTATCQGNFILTRGVQGTAGSYVLEYFDNAYNSCSQFDTNLYVLAGSAGASGAAASSWMSNAKIHTGTWYCGAITYDGSNLKVYTNGVNTATASTGTMGAPSTAGIEIGKYTGGGAAYPYNFIGILDDVALYNRALADTEIQRYCLSVMPPDTTVFISEPFSKTTICAGDTFHLNYSVNNTFNAGNVFTAQLSNSTGSFASPTSIGSLTSTNGGKIICTIPTATPQGTGYRVRITSSNPLRISADNGLNISIYPLPVPAVTGNSPVCEGDTLKLGASTAYTGVSYNWTGPGFTGMVQNIKRPNATVVMAGSYKVVTNLGGCKDSATITVVVNPKPAIAILSNSPVCIDDSIRLYGFVLPSGGLYSWTGPAGFSSTTLSPVIGNASNAMVGFYVLKATLNGCSSEDSAYVQIGNISVDIGNDTMLCNNKNGITLDATILGASYLWQDASTGSTFKATQTGKYYVTVTLASCIAADTINIAFNEVYFFLGNDTSLCPGIQLTLSVADTFSSYIWSTGATGNTIHVNKEGIYWLQAFKNGCSNSDTVKISYFQPFINLGNDTLLCNEEKLVLKASSLDGSTYTWQDESHSNDFAVSQPGIFWVRAENQCGSFSDTIKVDYENCTCNPLLPTVFSPNGDGRNDKIAPVVNCTTTAYSFIIANRWGNIVFRSKIPGEKWDGTFKGQPVEVGTYYYFLWLRGPQQQGYTRKGDITLVR